MTAPIVASTTGLATAVVPYLAFDRAAPPEGKLVHY